MVLVLDVLPVLFGGQPLQKPVPAQLVGPVDPRRLLALPALDVQLTEDQPSLQIVRGELDHHPLLGDRLLPLPHVDQREHEHGVHAGFVGQELLRLPEK